MEYFHWWCSFCSGHLSNITELGCIGSDNIKFPLIGSLHVCVHMCAFMLILYACEWMGGPFHAYSFGHQTRAIYHVSSPVSLQLDALKRVSLNQKFAVLAKRAGQQALKIYLSSISSARATAHITMLGFLIRVLRIWTQVLLLAEHVLLLTEPSSHALIL